MFPREVYGDTLDYIRPEQIPTVADKLLLIGFDPKDIDRIMGLSWLRVAKHVWGG